MIGRKLPKVLTHREYGPFACTATLTSGNTLPVSVPRLTNIGTTGAPTKGGDFDEQDTIVRILEEANGQVGGANGRGPLG